MALNLLSKSSALNPGSDLWIVPTYGQSRWAAILDWYLNFQVYKYQNKNQPLLSDDVKKILKSTEFSYKTDFLKLDSDPCLIGSSHLLPNRWVCVLPYENEDFASWAQKISKLISSLNNPSARFFLPPGRSSSDLSSALKPQLLDSDLTVVLDS